MLRSYSQEGEDMILRRLFEKQSDGFYVDVGAHHPKRFSNTFIFYSKGWKGINIDAMPGSMKAFNKQRPRDKNLEIPIAKERKNLTYFQFNEPALNGFCEELAVSRDGSTAYKIISKQSIEAYPLSVILDQHLNPAQSIDFLSVDVEGLDLEVLQSNDWLKFRPKVVLVEILNGSLDTIQNDEVYQFLTAHNYHLYAKAVHTVFFISDKFLAERMM
ncbi:MAG: FkbM family methyltransferase [Nostocales cyanobacterium LE14-WE4]|nr:FkbM family methyltransferase [Anabaena sp. 49633_E8]MCE2702960.1 FkbM family methyltransferase [Anabaena sp. 49633_E8]MDJ0501939.1 FkbM family methyltransferase [Nostocales cyanobacterium LE14-WE4]